MIQSKIRSFKLFLIMLLAIFISVIVLVSPKTAHAEINLAAGKIATADSELEGHAASNGNDGNPYTYWSAADNKDNHYWMVDLGGLYELNGTEVNWKKSTNYKYRIETSTDNSHWTLRIDKSNNASTSKKQKDNFIGVARYVKIIILDIPCGDNASIYDFSVFGTAFTSSSPTMIYLAGDSTMQTYSSSFAPQTGWGQTIEKYFDNKVLFDNRSIGARSSKSFIVEGRLNAILSIIRPNDYLLIQFGHNDATNIAGRHTDANGDYKDYLKQYIEGARAKGANPILLTPVARLNYSDGVFKNDFPAYVTAMKEVAAETNTPCIDMMNTCIDYYTSIGFEEVFPYYLASHNGTDYTHFTQAGADMLAKLVSQEIKKLNVSISQNVK